MFAFALGAPVAGVQSSRNVVCARRVTRMVTSDAAAGKGKEDVKEARKTMSYQNREYTEEEIEALKKRRQLMFQNRRVSGCARVCSFSYC